MARPLPYRRQSPREALSEAWHGRAVVRPLAARVVRKTYAKTRLGAAWLFIRPVVDAGGKTLLFGGVLGAVSSPGGVPYFLFLLVGMQGWRLFDQTLLWSTRGFDRYAKLTRSFSFPLLTVPIAASAFGWVEFGVYSAVVAVTFIAFVLADGTLYLNTSPELLLAPFALVLALAFALGLGMWLSVLNARWRDVRFTLRYVLELWLYVTPVIYPLSQLPPTARMFAQLNPMAPIVEMFKQGMFGSDVGSVSVLAAAWATVATLLAVASGLWFFARNAVRFNVPLVADDDDDDEDIAA